MLKLNRLAIMGFSAMLLLTGCESNDDENPELKVAELTPIENPISIDVLWRDTVGSGVGDFYSNLSPAFKDGNLFVASREGQIYALEGKSGDVIWQTDIRKNPPNWFTKLTLKTVKPAKVSGGITAAYNNLYLGTEDGEVIALSQKDGKELWRVNVKGEVVAAPSAGEGWIAVTTTSGHVVALHPDSGEQRWQVETEVPALSLRGTSSATIANGGVLLGTATGKLAVVILENGILAWEQAIANVKGATELEKLIDADSQPVISGTTVYVIAYNGNLAAMDMMSGQSKWKREYSSYRNLAVDQNMIYLTDSKGNVTAVDSLSGIEKWNSSVLYNRHLTQPVVHKDKIVVGDMFGFVHVLNKTDGTLVGRYKYGELDSSWLDWTLDWFTADNDSLYGKPVLGDDVIYFQSRNGVISALTLP